MARPLPVWKDLARRHALNGKLALCAIAALSCLTTQAAATTPTIANVSGTVTTGQTLTITGTTMVDENRAGWASPSNGSSYGFEGGNVATDWEFKVEGIGSAATVSSSVKLAGSQSGRFHIQGEHTGAVDHNPRASGIVYNDARGQFWARGYIRYDLMSGNWPSQYYKMWWFGGNVFQPDATGAGYPTQFLYTIPQSDGTFQRVNIHFGQMEAGRWYCAEIHYNPNVVYEGWIDDIRVWSVASGNNNPGWLEFGTINVDGTASNFSIDHYEDNVALSTTGRIRCSSVVEITNSATFGDPKTYQQPLFLSDGSIQIKADLSGLGSGTYYLWVTNNRGERSQPYSLTPPVVTCNQPSDCTTPTECHTASGATCLAGTCVYPNATDGSPCTDDGNSCTLDVCGAGVCTHPSNCGDAGSTGHDGGANEAGTRDAGASTDGGAGADSGRPSDDGCCANDAGEKPGATSDDGTGCACATPGVPKSSGAARWAALGLAAIAFGYRRRTRSR